MVDAVAGFRRDLSLNSEGVKPPSYHPRLRPPPPPPLRGPRENPPRCDPRFRPPPLGGGGPRGRGGFGERARLLFPENVERPREGPLDGGSPPRLALLGTLMERVLPRGAGMGRPRPPRDMRDIMSSSSGDGGRDHSLSRPRDRLGGPVSRCGRTVLRFVIISGSIPFKVNDDDAAVARKLLDGQSPTRCFALQQFAQQIDTMTWSE